MVSDLLQSVYFNNRVIDYLYALFVLVAGTVGVGVFKRVVIHRLCEWAKRTTTTIDEFLTEMIRRLAVPLLYFGVFYLALSSLNLHPAIRRAVGILGLAAMTAVTVIFIQAVVRYAIESYIARQAADTGRDKALRGFLSIVGVVIWALGIVFLLDNMGFKISTVIAGLGIGGIAVALAAQSILGDLFSYFTILFDKPFEIGDFIIVDDSMGVVEYVGIRTTRISSLGGEQIVMSNRDLTDSRLRNYKRMVRRRVLFRLGVVYQTDLAHLKEIPKIVEGVVREVPEAVFDRAHFFSYGDFALVFEVVYYVLGPDYNRYMDIQQEINLRIFEEFARRGIEFAYPTQTLYISKGEGVRV
jgi:small-conductance mechanosensitive channel